MELDHQAKERIDGKVMRTSPNEVKGEISDSRKVWNFRLH